MRRPGRGPARSSSPRLSTQAGAVISSVVLEGGDGYEFSGAMLAWAAERVLAGEARGRVHSDPSRRSGLDDLESGVAECGMSRRAGPAEIPK